jgi:hypothetical protein
MMARVAIDVPGGSAIITRYIGAALRRISHEPTSRNPSLVIGIWGYEGPHSPPRRWPSSIPMVRWWVGRDVEHLLAGRTEPLTTDRALNWASNEHIQGVLAGQGIESSVVYVTPDAEPRQLPLPPYKSVYTYCPNGQEERYCWEETIEVACRMPDVAFHVYIKSCDAPAPNMLMMGRVLHEEMEREWLRTRVMLRLIRHDGTCMAVQEALLRARHVVYSFPYPGCGRAETLGEAVEEIRERLDCGPNLSGMRAVVREREEQDRRLSELIGSILTRQRSAATLTGVGVTGDSNA